MLNIFNRLELFVVFFFKATFVFIPILLLFSWKGRRMFKANQALLLFLTALAFCFLWRLAFFVVQPRDFLLVRYLAPLIIFLIVMAVPGLYALADLAASFLASKWPSATRGRIMGVFLALVVAADLCKEFKGDDEKVFLTELGPEIEKISAARQTDDYVVFENVGEKGRLVYYSPFLERHLTSLKRVESATMGSIVEACAKYAQRGSLVMLFTRSKSLDDLKSDYAEKGLEAKYGPFPFKELKSYPYRKRIYILFEFIPQVDPDPALSK